MTHALQVGVVVVFGGSFLYARASASAGRPGARRDTAKLLPAPSDRDQEDDAAEFSNEDEEGKRLPPKP